MPRKARNATPQAEATAVETETKLEHALRTLESKLGGLRTAPRPVEPKPVARPQATPAETRPSVVYPSWQRNPRAGEHPAYVVPVNLPTAPVRGFDEFEARGDEQEEVRPSVPASVYYSATSLDLTTFTGFVKMTSPKTGNSPTFKVEVIDWQASVNHGRKQISLLTGTCKACASHWTAFGWVEGSDVTLWSQFLRDVRYEGYARVLSDPTAFARKGVKFEVQAR